MERVQIRTLFVVMALLLGCATACGAGGVPATAPTDTPTPTGLVVENVYWSPPEPYNGQTYVVIEGTLPDGCTVIDDLDHSYEARIVEVTIEASRPEGVACTQQVAPFKETLRVETGDMYSGTYTVTVNGESFAFNMEDFEFLVPETPDPGS